MVTTLRNMALAAVLAAGATALLSGQASALSMAECSAKFKAAKAAGTDGGVKWNDFRKAQCSTDAAAATDPAPAPAEPTKKMKKTKAAEAPAAASDGTKMSMQDCSAAWKQLKDSNAVPEGMTWNTFRSGGCVAPAAAAPMAKAKMTKPAATAPDATATDAKLSMTECSAAWKQLKASNAVPESMTWNTFRSGGCKAPAATMAKATKPDATAPAGTGEKMSMQDCSSAWKQLKANNAVPEGMTWNTFRSGGCKSPADAMAKPKATPASEKKTPSVIPPEPTDQADTSPIPTVDKNGKALTPGRIAAIKRIRACAAQYRQAKATNTMPAEIARLDSKRRWPQYWSQCNTQLKAAGQ